MKRRPGLEIQHSTLTIGQLSDRVETQARPVRRSTHIGNQPPAELAVMALPKGVDIVMVDTIQGNDRYTSPHTLKFGSQVVQLLSKNQASGRVVGSLTASAEAPASMAGKSISDIHNDTLSTLNLPNTPRPMMEVFSDHPDILGAVMRACDEAGEVQRKVTEGGEVRFGESIDIDRDGIFGLDHAATGAMLPLNGMMATDILIAHTQGADGSLQLAGPDMIRYTKHNERMEAVADRVEQARSLLGLAPIHHTYEVVSIAGLALVKAQSQHELLISGEVIDLSRHREVELSGAVA